MKTPMFSIIVVSLNPGHKLTDTMKSVAEQSYTDYEVIVKDGGSNDDSLETLREYLSGCKPVPVVRILEQADTGIYDGMNQAARTAHGEYLYFLNCGDFFASRTALEQAAKEIGRHLEADASSERIFYGDIFDTLRQQIVSSNPHIDAFACYRNVPCHQACIYHYSLFSERGYETKYRVRADYEHFLWCYFIKNVKPQYIPITLASYEGGGFSEMPENRKCSAREHRDITAQYLSRWQLLLYRIIMLLTLQPLRTKMAESPVWSGIYNACRRLLYQKTTDR